MIRLDAPGIRDLDVVGIPVADMTNLIAWHENTPVCDERHPMGKQLHATNHNQPIAVIVDITSPMKTQTPLRPRAVGQQLIDSDRLSERHLHPPGEAPIRNHLRKDPRIIQHLPVAAHAPAAFDLLRGAKPVVEHLPLSFRHTQTATTTDDLRTSGERRTLIKHSS